MIQFDEHRKLWFGIEVFSFHSYDYLRYLALKVQGRSHSHRGFTRFISEELIKRTNQWIHYQMFIPLLSLLPSHCLLPCLFFRGDWYLHLGILFQIQSVKFYCPVSWVFVCSYFKSKARRKDENSIHGFHIRIFYFFPGYMPPIPPFRRTISTTIETSAIWSSKNFDRNWGTGSWISAPEEQNPG